jgi:hypothetical protein
MMRRLAMEEASFQAEAFSSLARKPVKVGIKAELSAPAARSVNNVSATWLEAKKASNSKSGKARATRIPRTRPVICPITMANMTVPAARAI